MKRFKIALVTATICVFFPIIAFGAELSKSDATTILTNMGYKNLNLVAVINGIGAMGMGAFSSPNTAMAIGYAEQGGKGTAFHETFFYDKDIGWFFFQTNDASTTMKVWATKGFLDVKAKKP